MHNLLPGTSVANINEKDTADSPTKKNLADIGHLLALHATELGLATNLADMFRDNPLSAETAFREMICGLARSVLTDAFEMLDDHGPSLEMDATTYRKAEVTPGRAMTTFGPVNFDRSRYRPSCGGAALVPAESMLGLTAGGLTPAAAGLSMCLMSALTARESEDVWARLCGEGPSVASLIRLSGEAGNCMDDCCDELLAELRNQEELPEAAVSVLVSLDGVMVHMNAETVQEKATNAGWREASCGVVALVDDKGNMLESRYFGRFPEACKKSLKSQLKAEVSHWIARKPDLKLAAVADGTKDNWTFLESLQPDVILVDFWHAAQHLSAAADAAFGKGTAAAKTWFEKWRHVLRHDPKGASKVIDALRYLVRKVTKADGIRAELGYFRNNRSRMNYAQAASVGFAIGSGAVEAANKVLVTSRMKRSGQRWGRDGGQGVLSFRALLKSGRFDGAWTTMVPRLNRGDQWKPPKCANDNQTVAQDALAA